MVHTRNRPTIVKITIPNIEDIKEFLEYRGIINLEAQQTNGILYEVTIEFRNYSLANLFAENCQYYKEYRR